MLHTVINGKIKKNYVFHQYNSNDFFHSTVYSYYNYLYQGYKNFKILYEGVKLPNKHFYYFQWKQIKKSHNFI